MTNAREKERMKGITKERIGTEERRKNRKKKKQQRKREYT